MSSVRDRLVDDFARWIASCATRSTAPVRSGKEIYAALDAVDFDSLFQVERGPIREDEFDAWHRSAVAGMRATQPKLNVGWAAKMINEYLKTKCYVGGYGRDGLIDLIHPPIDNGLVRGLKKEFADNADMREGLDSLQRIGDMDTYPKYANAVRVCRCAASISNCSLLEVEQFWD